MVGLLRSRFIDMNQNLKIVGSYPQKRCTKLHTVGCSKNYTMVAKSSPISGMPPLRLGVVSNSQGCATLHKPRCVENMQGLLGCCLEEVRHPKVWMWCQICKDFRSMDDMKRSWFMLLLGVVGCSMELGTSTLFDGEISRGGEDYEEDEDYIICL